MTDDARLALVAQYRAGIEAEIALLHQLGGIAHQQHAHAESRTLDEIPDLVDHRNRVMAGLVAIEHEMKPVRAALLAERDALVRLPEYDALTALHQQASSLVSGILSADQGSLTALREAEEARRFASRAIEQGESTLAAYRRVVAPPLEGATLVNRKG